METFVFDEILIVLFSNFPPAKPAVEAVTMGAACMGGAIVGGITTGVGTLGLFVISLF